MSEAQQDTDSLPQKKTTEQNEVKFGALPCECRYL